MCVNGLVVFSLTRKKDGQRHLTLGMENSHELGVSPERVPLEPGFLLNRQVKTPSPPLDEE